MRRRLTPSGYRRMPWRNGGGVTTELVVGFGDARELGAAGDGGRFLYRVSIADVTSDGPFSRFDGYDRHIMLVRGAGMTLECGEQHGRIDLTLPFSPRMFSGDWEVHGSLTLGPVSDFNLMVDRARASASLDVRVIDKAEDIFVGPNTTCILHVFEGNLADASEGDTVLTDESIRVVPIQPSRIALMRIVAIGD